MTTLTWTSRLFNFQLKRQPQFFFGFNSQNSKGFGLKNNLVLNSKSSSNLSFQKNSLFHNQVSKSSLFVPKSHRGNLFSQLDNYVHPQKTLIVPFSLSSSLVVGNSLKSPVNHRNIGSIGSGRGSGSPWANKLKESLLSTSPLSLTLKGIIVIGLVYLFSGWIWFFVKYLGAFVLCVVGVYFFLKYYRRKLFKSFFLDSLKVLKQNESKLKSIFPSPLDLNGDKLIKNTHFIYERDGTPNRFISIQFPLDSHSSERGYPIMGFIVIKGRLAVTKETAPQLVSMEYRYIEPDPVTRDLLKKRIDIFSCSVASTQPININNLEEEILTPGSSQSKSKKIEEVEEVEIVEKKSNQK